MKSTQRIGLLLALVFLLPALFFSVYEISSLNKDEEMIQEIYTKQLEAILFSVNQYSDDILVSWISKTEAGLEEGSVADTIPKRIQDLLTLNTSLEAILVYDTTGAKSDQKVFTLADINRDSLSVRMENSLIENKAQVQQLIAYKKSGFQKTEALLSWDKQDDTQCLIFITENSSQQFQLVGLLVDPDVFIQDIVGPRLQVIAKDQFVLSAFSKETTAPVYSTLTSDSVAVGSEALTKNFWLFPDYTLGIRVQGSSLQKLINDRTTTNLMLLVSLDVILVVAVVLVFRNVRREVQLAQNKADFVSNVSHEIRTPLALISMFAETLELGRVKSEQKKKEYYSIISKETQRLSGIVNKILNFSQTEANKKILHLHSIHIGTAIKEILVTYDFHLVNKGFEYTFTDTADVWVKADKEAFVEVVINLIDNAMKYSADKKYIEISTGRENGYGLVIVKDHGIGISPMDQKHIFDKFYRVSSGNLANSRGTGLGLSLVKQLMEAQQGKVTVSSTLGKGSLFTLYFPFPPIN